MGDVKFGVIDPDELMELGDAYDWVCVYADQEAMVDGVGPDLTEGYTRVAVVPTAELERLRAIERAAREYEAERTSHVRDYAMLRAARDRLFATLKGGE